MIAKGDDILCASPGGLATPTLVDINTRCSQRQSLTKPNALTSIEGELKTLRAELADYREKPDNSAGLTKEIDHALERIARIEKHLGLDHRAAA